MKTENFKPGKTPFSKGNCISTRQFLLFNTAAASCHIPPPAPPDKIFWVLFLAQNKRVQWLALTPEQLKFTGILTQSKAKWPIISYFGKCSYSKSHSFASGESSWWKWYNTWRIHFKRFGVTVWQMCWKMPDYSSTAWSTEATRFPPLSLKWCKEKEIFNLLIQPFLSQLERREISQTSVKKWVEIGAWFPDLFPSLLNCIQICISGEIIFPAPSLGGAGRCGLIKHHWALELRTLLLQAVQCDALPPPPSLPVPSSSCHLCVSIHIWTCHCIRAHLSNPAAEQEQSSSDGP